MEIVKVLQFLKQKELKYCLIEIDNSKRELENLRGEIDLIVENKDDFSVLINHLIADKWKVVYEFSQLGFIRIQLIKRDFLNNCFYKLDILNSFFHEKKGQLFSLNNLSNNEFEIIKGRTYLKGNNLFLIYLIKILIEGSKSKIKKLNESCDQDFFLRKEVMFLTENSTSEKFKDLLDEINKGGFVAKHNFFEKNKIFKKIVNFLNRYIFFKNIPMIGFVGLDGAGKSTIIANICEQLNQQDLSCNVVYLGHKEYEIDCLKRINSKNKKSIFDTLVYVLLWPIEVRIRVNKAIRSSNFLLFDRHPNYEPIIPKGIKYIFLNIAYKVMAKILIPLPDFNFFLTGDNHILWNRKKEDSFSSYEKRVSALKDIIKKSNIDTFMIKTDVTLENSLMNIKTKIIEYFKDIT